MKETALERQTRLDREARERVVREDQEREARTAQLAAKWKEERQAQCGTPSGYQRHRRNEEKPCQACKDANRDYNRQKDAQRKERANQRKREKRQAAGATPRVLKPCGTTAAARRHHRKGEELCGPCREAYRENMKELNARRNKLRAEGKTLQQVSAQKRAAMKKREREERLSDKTLMACCGAPIAGDEGTAKYAKRHWVEKTDLCDPARQCRNLSDRLRWIQKYGEPRELEPCGTEGAFKRHQRAGEEPCQPCRDAHNAWKREYEREYRRQKREQAEPETMACCGAPSDGSEPTGKYAGRHQRAFTPSCWAALECRNQKDRLKNGRKPREEPQPCGTPAAFQRHQRAGEECAQCRAAHNLAEKHRKRKKRAEPAPPEVERMPCCGAPVDGSERTQKYTSRHRHRGTPRCQAARLCRNAVDRKKYKPRKSTDDVNERRRRRRSA